MKSPRTRRHAYMKVALNATSCLTYALLHRCAAPDNNAVIVLIFQSGFGSSVRLLDRDRVSPGRSTTISLSLVLPPSSSEEENGGS